LPRRLHPRHDVTGGVERDPDARVTEPLLYDLRMDACPQGQRRVSVPPIVKPNQG